MTATDGNGPTSDAIRARATSYALNQAAAVEADIVELLGALRMVASAFYIGHGVSNGEAASEQIRAARVLLQNKIRQHIASAFYIGHGAGLLERRR